MKSKQMKQNGPPQGEESFNQLDHIFGTALLRTEPFQSRANLLKDLRYDIDVIKRNFPPKSHYHKNGNGSANGNANKSRSVSIMIKYCLPMKQLVHKLICHQFVLFLIHCQQFIHQKCNF